ncbi:myosin light chain kinase, partial [Nannochloropsis oceanica]
YYQISRIIICMEALTTICGSPGYMAPEILSEAPYNEKADVWAVGTILFCLLGGYNPFEGRSTHDLTVSKDKMREVLRGKRAFKAAGNAVIMMNRLKMFSTGESLASGRKDISLTKSPSVASTVSLDSSGHSSNPILEGATTKNLHSISPREEVVVE